MWERQFMTLLDERRTLTDTEAVDAIARILAESTFAADHETIDRIAAQIEQVRDIAPVTQPQAEHQ